jgi:hypothetical protein
MVQRRVTYPDYAVHDAIAVPAPTRLATSAGSGSARVVEGTIGPAPDAPLPVLRYSLVLDLAGLQLETGFRGAFAGLSRNARINDFLTLVGDDKRG